jgi:Flp pilus assembly protein TadD
MIDPTKATFKEAIASATRKAAGERTRLTSLKAAAAGSPAASLQAGDVALSLGDYAAAADLFRAAAASPADAAAANPRLGIALALAGRKAEAEAAFAAVAGPRAELAALWLAWLKQRA